ADVTLLVQCSNQIAIAVQNALNFESAREAEQQMAQERDRSQLLLELNNAVISHLDLKTLLKSLSNSLRRIMPLHSTFLGLCDAQGTQMQVQALDLGQMKEDVFFGEGILVPLDGTPEQQAIATRQPVLITSVADLARFSSPWVKYSIEQGIKA